MKNGIIRRKLFRLARDERGSEIAEFAVTASAMVLFLAGIFQSLLAIYAYHFTSYAAHRAARFAMVRGYTWSQGGVPTSCSTSAPPQFSTPYECTATATDIQNYVLSLATPGINRNNLSINTTSSYVWPGTTPGGSSTPCAYPNSQGCLVKVTVSYSLNVLPYIRGTTLKMAATSEKVIVQ